MRNMSNKFGGAIQVYEYCIVWIGLPALFIDLFLYFLNDLLLFYLS